MLWLAAAREGLDDDHAAAAAWAWLRQHARLLWFGGAVGLVRRRAGQYGEQLAGARDVSRAKVTPVSSAEISRRLEMATRWV